MLNFKPFYSILLVILFLFGGFLFAQIEDNLFFKEAKTALTKVEHLCMKDSGRLWGENLYCPLVIVKRENRALVCNCKTLFPNTLPHNGIYYGYLDDSIVVAGTACTINGTVCAMLPYDLATDTANWQTFLHEMFHAFQNNKGLKYMYNNAHLDNPDARVLLSCEMKALMKALTSDSTEKRHFLSEALFFRKERQCIYPDKAKDECLFEIHEGLANYTQYRLSLYSDAEINQCLQQKLETTLKQNGYVRSYGYTVGAVYAFLNDVHPKWRCQLDTLSSLSDLTRRIYGIDVSVIDSIQLYAEYKVDSLLASEDSIFQIKLKLKEKTYQAIKANKALVLNYEGCHLGFNPNHVIGFNDGNNFYQFMEIRGDFGSIYTTYGCLLSDKIYILIPDNVVLHLQETYPEHFDIHLNNGWKIKDNQIVSLIKH